MLQTSIARPNHLQGLISETAAAGIRACDGLVQLFVDFFSSNAANETN
jgi:hypothetical protein